MPRGLTRFAPSGSQGRTRASGLLVEATSRTSRPSSRNARAASKNDRCHPRSAETHIPSLAKHTAATHCRHPQPEPWGRMLLTWSPESLGFAVDVSGDSIRARRGQEEYGADEPVALLGLIRLVDMPSWEWHASDDEIAETLLRFRLEVTRTQRQVRTMTYEPTRGPQPREVQPNNHRAIDEHVELPILQEPMVTGDSIPYASPRTRRPQEGEYLRPRALLGAANTGASRSPGSPAGCAPRRRSGTGSTASMVVPRPDGLDTVSRPQD